VSRALDKSTGRLRTWWVRISAKREQERETRIQKIIEEPIYLELIASESVDRRFDGFYDILWGFVFVFLAMHLRTASLTWGAIAALIGGLVVMSGVRSVSIGSTCHSQVTLGRWRMIAAKHEGLMSPP